MISSLSESPPPPSLIPTLPSLTFKNNKVDVCPCFKTHQATGADFIKLLSTEKVKMCSILSSLFLTTCTSLSWFCAPSTAAPYQYLAPHSLKQSLIKLFSPLFQPPPSLVSCCKLPHVVQPFPFLTSSVIQILTLPSYTKKHICLQMLIQWSGWRSLQKHLKSFPSISLPPFSSSPSPFQCDPSPLHALT